MDNLSLLQKRIFARGSNVEHRLANDKLKTLKKALTYSYQAETVVVGELEYRALLNNNKLKMDYDDKIISIPFDSEFKVGTIFYWPRIKEHWIVYLRQYSEDAYFRGYARRAQQTIRWEDEFGMIHETLAAVRGPVETKIRSEQKSGNSFDVPNYTLSIIIPNNEETKKIKRYSKIALDGKMWEVAVTDGISEPGVIDVQALEYYVNREEDSNLIDPNAPSNSKIDNVVVKTSLDDISVLEVDEAFRLWAVVEQDGDYSEILTKDARFSVVSGVASISAGYINILEPAKDASVKLDIPKIGFSKVFTFEARQASMPAAVKFLIAGDENVKSFGKTKYTIKYYLDGVEATHPDGRWAVQPNDKLFSIGENNKDFIELKWVVGVHGSLILDYLVDDMIVATKTVLVKSLI